ncbi:phosphoglucomutase/phosphomannomutase family protein [bacterium]|nr:phosphoglucomutase/phosphomannomutase family protein [bacterium]
MSKAKIKFGTSGWRAILAEDFTFENAARVVDAIILYLRSTGKSELSVVVGSDARFLGKEFRERTAKQLAKAGINVYCTERDCPTPVLSFCIRSMGLDGAINYTASHNPAEYQGLKFSVEHGEGAGTEVTKFIEQHIDQPVAPAESEGKIIMLDPREPYFAELTKLVDLEAIKKANLKVACDVLYGTGREYLDEMLKRAGTEVTALHNWVNPSFGGRRPEPAAENMPELIKMVKEGPYALGLGTDGDADRFGIVDSDGTFYNANQVLCLVSWHLAKNRGLKGAIVRSVATTGYLDRLAKYLDAELIEVPVGFKYIAPYVLEGKVLLGGEESGGLTIGAHIPEKDGILACLLITELVAVTGKTLGQTMEEIKAAIGSVWTGRTDLFLTPENKAKILEAVSKEEGETFLGRKVVSRNKLDGFKFNFENNEWVLVRPSGTEPIIRCYVEANTPEDGTALTAELKAFTDRFNS